MNSAQRKRLAARFARLWKYQVRADDGRRHRRANREAAAELKFRRKRAAMIAMTIAAAVALVLLLLPRSQ
jgi:hypothetical protein